MSKATLSLIPLLGIQYLCVPYISEEYGVPKKVTNVVIPITIIITASHGIVVSFLYCFTSSEMKDAIVRRWRLHRELQGIYNEISSRRQSLESRQGYTFQYFLNRIHGRRGSGLLRNLDPAMVPENLSCDSRNEQVFPVLPAGLPVGKRHSACSKNSHDSLHSNGYYSSHSAHHDYEQNVEMTEKSYPILHIDESEESADQITVSHL
jgi:hypothetical protein